MEGIAKLFQKRDDSVQEKLEKKVQCSVVGKSRSPERPEVSKLEESELMWRSLLEEVSQSFETILEVCPY